MHACILKHICHAFHTNHAEILQLRYCGPDHESRLQALFREVSWGMQAYNFEALDYTNIQLRHRWGSAGRVFMTLPDFARGVLWVMAYLVSKVAAKCDGFVANFSPCLGQFTGNLRLLGTSAFRSIVSLCVCVIMVKRFATCQLPFKALAYTYVQLF